MKLGRRLQARDFARPCLDLARALVGCTLVHRLPDGTRLAGRLVEVEAYCGDGSDPAAHSHRGPTRRNRTMFGPAGRLYAYRRYGIHVCVNVVCSPPGEGAAVLLRALEPVDGLERMARLRAGGTAVRTCDLARGPGRLTRAMAFGLEHDGASLLRGPISLHAPTAAPPEIESGPRVGISRATGLPWRFYEAASPWVSPFRPGRRRR